MAGPPSGAASAATSTWTSGAVARHTIGGQAQQRCLWNAATYDLRQQLRVQRRRLPQHHRLALRTLGLRRGRSALPPGAEGAPHARAHAGRRTGGAAGHRAFARFGAPKVQQPVRDQRDRTASGTPGAPGSSPPGPTGTDGPRPSATSARPPARNGSYDGVSFGLTKREGRFKANVSYTWSKLEGTVAGGTNNAWGDIPGRDVFLYGYLPDDHRHAIKAAIGYQATPWLSFGSRTIYTSGFPYDRLFRNPETTTYDVYRAPRGINPGTNINDPTDDRELRLPDQLEVNVQGRVNLMPLIGRALDFYVDVLNLLALRTANSVATNDRQDFGVQRGWMDPFRIRLGLNFRY